MRLMHAHCKQQRQLWWRALSLHKCNDRVHELPAMHATSLSSAVNSLVCTCATSNSVQELLTMRVTSLPSDTKSAHVQQQQGPRATCDLFLYG
eukprot:1161810-Pelagomonas_calceolata.AAC.18